MNRCIIMRGIPGSGKSYWASEYKRAYPSTVIVSADTFFMRHGVYTFDPDKLPMAHADCLRAFVGFVRGAASDVDIIVDNTNTRAWEIAPYYALALAYGFDPLIVRVHCDFKTAATRCVHGVRLGTIEAMLNSTEPIPPHWKVQHVFN